MGANKVLEALRSKTPHRARVVGTSLRSDARATLCTEQQCGRGTPKGARIASSPFSLYAGTDTQYARLNGDSSCFDGENLLLTMGERSLRQPVGDEFPIKRQSASETDRGQCCRQA